MALSSAFPALMAELGQHAQLDLAPDEEGAICLRFDDDVLLQCCDSGQDVFALIADTGIETATIRPEVLSELCEMFLQINFITALSSRFSIALSSTQTIVMTYSDYATRTTGAQLFTVVESLLEKCRSLRQLILEMGVASEDAPGEGDSAARYAAFGKFA